MRSGWGWSQQRGRSARGLAYLLHRHVAGESAQGVHVRLVVQQSLQNTTKFRAPRWEQHLDCGGDLVGPSPWSSTRGKAGLPATQQQAAERTHSFLAPSVASVYSIFMEPWSLATSASVYGRTTPSKRGASMLAIFTGESCKNRAWLSADWPGTGCAPTAPHCTPLWRAMPRHRYSKSEAREPIQRFAGARSGDSRGVEQSRAPHLRKLTEGVDGTGACADAAEMRQR